MWIALEESARDLAVQDVPRSRVHPTLKHADRITHTELVPARPAVVEPWPDHIPESVRDAFPETAGVLWAHQAEALNHLAAGRHVALATGTSSGKSLVFQAAGLAAIQEGRGGSRAGRASPAHRPLHRPDEGARGRPVAPAGSAGRHGRGRRRRQQSRGSRVGAQPRRLDPHQPRHPAPRPAARARTMDPHPRRPALRRRR